MILMEQKAISIEHFCAGRKFDYQKIRKCEHTIDDD